MNIITRRKKIEAIAITAILAISVFAGVMIAMAQPEATPEDADEINNVVPGKKLTREY